MTLNNTLYYNWKKHVTGCNTSPTTLSITDQSSGATLYNKRLGSWHFYQAMGQPSIGTFVCYNNICYEYMGTTQDPAAGGVEYLAQKPSPALTSSNHFANCVGCFSGCAAQQTYHAFEMCNSLGAVGIGLENNSTVTVQSNINVYVGLGSPALNKTATYNGICIIYKGMYAIGDAALTSTPFIFNSNATPYLNPHVHNDNCAACQGTGGTTFHEWKMCGSTEVINILGVSDANSSANNETFYISAGSPSVGAIVNLNPAVTNRSGNCWEYMGTNTLPALGMQNIAVVSPASYTDCTTCLNPGTGGCTDITATNYNPLATFDDGSCLYSSGCTDPTATNYNPAATLDDGSCYYCVYGCMDQNANNYNAAATCDDSTCRYTVGGLKGTCDISFSELCAADGTSTVTVDLSAGTGINNITTKLQGSVVDGQSCSPATNVTVTGVTENQTISVTGECSYEKEDYDAGSAAPQPGWAATECGQVTVSSNTKVYAFYDGTSLGATPAKNAYKALMGWLKGVANFTADTVHGSPTQNVFHTSVAGERWLDWGTSVLTGKFNNNNIPQQYSLNGGALSTISHCTAGSDCARKKNGTSDGFEDAFFESPINGSKAIAISNWAHDTATESANGFTWTVDEFYDTAEGSLIGQPMFDYGSNSNNGSQTWNGYPPLASNTDDVLVVVFADESMWSYHVGQQNEFTNSTNPYTHTSGGNSYANIDPQQPTLQYKADYDKFKAIYAGHGGSYRAFLYPSRPDNVSTSGGHKMFPLHALASIHSGNNVPADGMWQTGTSPTNAYSTIDIIETENPYWTGLSPTYGALDQSGWGVNVAGVSFDATTFQNDLEVFLGLNAQTCDGSQCTVIQVLDENGTPVSSYPITVNGTSIGSTDAAGQITTTITAAGSVVINGCYTFNATGNCLQSLITINTISASYTSNLNCITGCTDPLSWNYNPLAGIDDGSCMYPLTEEEELSRCEKVKLDTECQFATDVFNLYKYERYGLDKGCLYNFDGHISKKYSMDWDDKLLPDFGTESYTKTLHTKGATPKPLWVDSACGGSSCDGSECVYFYVKDKNDKAVEDYEIVLDGIVIGKTDENGELRHSIPNAAEDTEHKVNFCHCFTTTGGCNSQRIKITVEGITECNTCGLESVACTCIPTETAAGDIALEVLGCTDSTATNYNALANCDDGSCIETVVGCMDPTSLNYNPCANVACSGCCCSVAGCMDSTADNYNASACLDDGSCLYTGCMDTTASNYNSQANVACSSCCTYPGCTDATALNYDPQANVDDGSCILPVYGCMDSTALNYNAAANVDDGSCTYCVYGCMDATASNYNSLATCTDGSCTYPIQGCTDASACNYDPLATVDDGSCLTVPTMDLGSTNFGINSPNLLQQDGSGVSGLGCATYYMQAYPYEVGEAFYGGHVTKNISGSFVLGGTGNHVGNVWTESYFFELGTDAANGNPPLTIGNQYCITWAEIVMALRSSGQCSDCLMGGWGVRIDQGTGTPNTADLNSATNLYDPVALGTLSTANALIHNATCQTNDVGNANGVNSPGAPNGSHSNWVEKCITFTATASQHRIHMYVITDFNQCTSCTAHSGSTKHGSYMGISKVQISTSCSGSCNC